MQNSGPFLRVGLLLLGGVAALVGLIVFFSGERIRDGRDFETYFQESVQGLDVGTPVRFRGVNLGKVTDIGLATASYGGDVFDAARTNTSALVVVRFRIDMSKLGSLVSVETGVKEGLRARIANQGITGVNYIELNFEEPGKFPPLNIPWKPHDTYIPSVPSTLVQVQDAAQQLLVKLNAVDLAGFLDNMNALVADVREQLDHGDVHTVLVQAQAALAAASNATDGQETRTLIVTANQAVSRLANAMAQLPSLIQGLQVTVRRADNGTADLQQSLSPILRDIQATLANLRDASAQLRRDPGQLLFGAPPPHPKAATP
jgi:ABC-type transporter Mla subunit MlaD